MKEFEKAHACYLSVFERRKKIFGENHEDTLISLRDLGISVSN